MFHSFRVWYFFETLTTWRQETFAVEICVRSVPSIKLLSKGWKPRLFTVCVKPENELENLALESLPFFRRLDEVASIRHLIIKNEITRLKTFALTVETVSSNKYVCQRRTKQKWKTSADRYQNISVVLVPTVDVGRQLKLADALFSVIRSLDALSKGDITAYYRIRLF